jgi:tetratricopeptide (TPR) repeat protein
MDENDGFAHMTLGYVYLQMRKYEKAIASGERAVELQPNGALVHMLLGATLKFAGHVDEGIAYIKQGIRLNPFPAYYYYYHLGRSYIQKGQYEDALVEFKKARQRAPDAGHLHFSLAVAYVLLDREKEARASAAKGLEFYPDISLAYVSKLIKYKNQANSKRTIDALRKAGIPE